MLAAGIEHVAAGHQQAVSAMEDAAKERGRHFEQRLSWLAMSAMVGLLGAVWGMVAAFMVIAQSDVAPKPSELAQGVSQALITTVWGVLQAIAAVFYTYLRNRIARLAMEAEFVSERVLKWYAAAVRKPPGADRPRIEPRSSS
jgi:biopolymer transport protein ExbB